MITLPEITQHYDPEGLHAWVAEQPWFATFRQHASSGCLLYVYFRAVTQANILVTSQRVYMQEPMCTPISLPLRRGWQKLLCAFDHYRFPAQEEGDTHYTASRDEVLKFLEEYLGS